MPTTIAIICTLDELVLHSFIDPAKFRYFSVHLSVGLRGDPVVPGAEAKLLQPWLHSAVPTIKLYGDSKDSGELPDGDAIATLTIDKAAVHCSQIGAVLSQRFSSAVTADTGPYFLWADEPNTPTPPVPGDNWTRTVDHASTYTAPVPHSLNLAFHFKVDVSTDPAKSATRFFVAPIFKVDGVKLEPGDTPGTPDANKMVA